MTRRDVHTGQFTADPAEKVPVLGGFADDEAQGGVVPTIEHIGEPGAGATAFSRPPLDPRRQSPQAAMPATVVGPGAAAHEVPFVEHLDVGGTQGADRIAAAFRRPPITSGREKPSPAHLARRPPGE